MRLLTWLLFVSAFGSGYSQFIRLRVRRSTDLIPHPTDLISEQVLDQERKERRLLRKKKQRLQQLREEIRILSSQLNEPTPDELQGFQSIDSKNQKKRRLINRDEKWKRKVLEKMKRIVRRLDRMERNLTTQGRIRKIDGKGNKQMRIKGKNQRISPTSTVIPHMTTVVAVSTPEAIKTSITPPNKVTDKERIFQSSVAASRKGNNFTACGTHKDCRPGRCCHRTVVNSTLQSVCVFHSLAASSTCLDSCQCAPTLSCFRPFPIEEDIENKETTVNGTRKAYCKKAETNDIINGDYIFNQNAVFADKKKRKR
ncbi:hypothetical protein WR25_01347 [Diploscapter pachys]|uniref:Uncharacterized protein n=1 Tax=Diploscapter pachys TaxID=2018661 RepID=A0A2A2JHN5_9BILA|nr:hypothetical protein WR25_01347 [Diploscapter pachys]